VVATCITCSRGKRNDAKTSFAAERRVVVDPFSVGLSPSRLTIWFLSFLKYSSTYNVSVIVYIGNVNSIPKYPSKCSIFFDKINSLPNDLPGSVIVDY